MHFAFFCLQSLVLSIFLLSAFCLKDLIMAALKRWGFLYGTISFILSLQSVFAKSVNRCIREHLQLNEACLSIRFVEISSFSFLPSFLPFALIHSLISARDHIQHWSIAELRNSSSFSGTLWFALSIYSLPPSLGNDQISQLNVPRALRRSKTF